MREFTFDDGFALSEILDKMNIDIDMNAMGDALKQGNKEAQAYFGGQLILTLVKKLHLARPEIVAFVSAMTGDTKDEVKKYKISQIKDFFVELFKQEGLVDFFS